MQSKEATDPIDIMKREVLNYVKRKGDNLDQLISWLNGYGLPVVGKEDEPYLWLLRGLPQGRMRYEIEVGLASKVGLILYQVIGGSISEKGNEKVFYNLFKLCSGLSCPDQLSEPLNTLYNERHSLGSYLGIDLQECLINALIKNQIDRRLENHWISLIESNSASLITQFNLFEAVLMMPKSKEERGRPAVAAIGKALHEIAKSASTMVSRRVVLLRLIMKVKNTYPSQMYLDQDLFMQAHRLEWPAWAVDCLPIYSPLRNKSSKKMHKCFVQRVIGDQIVNFLQQEVEEAICGERIYKIEIPSKYASSLSRFGVFVYHKIDECDFKSERGWFGATATAYSEYEDFIRPKDPLLADILQQGRREYLKTIKSFRIST